MKRPLLNLLAILSLLLCGVVAAAWGRSHSRQDDVHWRNGRYSVYLTSDHALCRVAWGPVYRGPNSIPPSPSYGHAAQTRRPGNRSSMWDELTLARYHRFARLGLAFSPNQLVRHPRGSLIPDYYSGNRLYFPAWMAVVALAALPAGRHVAWVTRRRRHRRRRSAHLCPACGYDLTGNVSGVCPECGTGRGSVGPANSASSSRA